MTLFVKSAICHHRNVSIANMDISMYCHITTRLPFHSTLFACSTNTNNYCY